MNFPETPGCCPDWAADDALDDLFRVWFGAYGTSAQGVSLKKQVSGLVGMPVTDRPARSGTV